MTGQPAQAHAVITLGDAHVSIRARGKFRDHDARAFVPDARVCFASDRHAQLRWAFRSFVTSNCKHSMDIFDIPIIFNNSEIFRSINPYPNA